MNIQPLHDVQDKDKLQTLISDMEINGYVGRPILVIDMGDYYQALTGSHRIVAANKTGTKIPVEIISNVLINDICDNCNWTVEMIMRDLDGFYLDLKDYDESLATLLQQDL